MQIHFHFFDTLYNWARRDWRHAKHILKGCCTYSRPLVCIHKTHESTAHTRTIKPHLYTTPTRILFRNPKKKNNIISMRLNAADYKYSNNFRDVFNFFAHTSVFHFFFSATVFFYTFCKLEALLSLSLCVGHVIPT